MLYKIFLVEQYTGLDTIAKICKNECILCLFEVIFMQNEIKITYLLNSGFILELKDCAIVFDYYQDENNIVEKIIKTKKEVYFFVSHRHYDHFNPEINKFEPWVTNYFISYDVTENLPVTNKLVVLDEYMSYDDKNIHIKSFSSTDEGISFFVEKDGWKIFHAGDFNWWHWKGDTAENNAFAKNGFKKQIKRLEGMTTDIAFFPVDSRQEEFLDLGVRDFCHYTNVCNLITMHNVGQLDWIVPNDLPNKSKIKSLWSPKISGESKLIKR